MNSDIGLLLVSVGAALVAGLVLGMLLGALLKRSVARPAPPPPLGDEILRIEGDPARRKLSLRLAGRPVAGPDSIAEPEVREHVRALMRLLDPAPASASQPMAQPVAPPAPVAAPRPAAVRPPPPAASAPGSDLVPAPLPDVEDDLSAPFLARLKSSLSPQTIPIPQPPQVSVVRAPKAPPAAQPPADMFEQINAILHRKLAGQPQAPDIQLYGEDGELRILVGSTVFHKVEEVTDERARGWIREAVSEWEAG